MITELKWDTKFFGRKIGRLASIPPENRLRKLILNAKKDGYRYITCRLMLDKISGIQLLESQGFYVTDIGAVWETKLSFKFQVSSFKFKVREATIKDIPMLKSMVKGLFKDSRFYNDPFFREREADRLYQAWIENFLHDKTAKTFLAEGGGFITCKKISKNMGDIPLIGVISKAQGKGIGSSLMHQALKWFVENGIKTITVRTQANNISAMNFYNGLGFRIKHVDVTMGMILNHDA